MMATGKAGRTNGLRKGVMRRDCPGSWDWNEQNGKRPPGRRESASDCRGKNGVKDHRNGQGNLAAAQRFDCSQRARRRGAVVGCPPPRGCCRGGRQPVTGTRHRELGEPHAGTSLLPHRHFRGVQAPAAPALPTALSPPQTSFDTAGSPGKHPLRGQSKPPGLGLGRTPTPALIRGLEPRGMLLHLPGLCVLWAPESHGQRFLKVVQRSPRKPRVGSARRLCLPRFQNLQLNSMA